MKLTIAIFALALAFQSCSPKTTAVANSSASLETATFAVSGNCGMCKKSIEGASKKAGAAAADWNDAKQVVTVKFDKQKTSVDAIQKSIAKYGYDNEKYKATKEAYDNLPGCCHYDRKQ
jgi:hypothetical protein